MTLTEACGKVYRHMEQRADYSPYYTHCAGDKDPLCKGYGEFFHRPHFAFYKLTAYFPHPFLQKNNGRHMPPEILEIQPHNNGTSHFCETEIQPFHYKIIC
jgi:hypothetical protein